MPAYLGPYGDLVPFAHWREGQSVSGEIKGTFYRTLAGNRVYARSLGFHRSWDLKTSDLDPADAAGIEVLLRGALGSGPFNLVDPHAQVTNAMSPAGSLAVPDLLVSVSQGAIPGDPVRIAPGVKVPTLKPTRAEVALLSYTALPPSGMITASVYTSPGAKVWLRYLKNGILSFEGSTFSTTAESVNGLQRQVSSLTPPSGMESAYFMISGASVVAAPAITWTPSPMPWSPGNGSRSVVVTGWSKDYDHASSVAGARRDVDFKVTVSEVGRGS